ncbi:histidinol-phosphate transaminase [Granulicoccus sp. GXG6511]|uniref:histidinol-phosphate transaminase n=1 Tax=Granulicoccus sp. GXG6511 TaxID=3381351 RepID=UPI003D7C786E
MAVPIRAAVAALPAYKPGKPAATGDGTFKLSSNENPFPPLPEVLAAVQDACTGMNRYPDMGNSAALAALANFLTTDAVPVVEDNLSFGTGSVAVLYHLLQAVCEPGDEVIYAWRSFEAYPIAVQVCGAVPVEVPLRADATHDLDAMLAAITPRTRAILVCTPNNPTGPAVGHEELQAFIDAVPEHILVAVDEAYVEFITDPAAARGLELWQDRPNVSVLRTFSKAYGLAGFRVGYAVAEPALTAAVRAVSLPFGVSVPAQAAVIAALAAHDRLLAQVAELVRERDALAAGLADLGFELPDTQANFVWFGARERTADFAAEFTKAGLMVRPYIAGGPWDGVRVTVGEPEANARVLDVARRLRG